MEGVGEYEEGLPIGIKLIYVNFIPIGGVYRWSVRQIVASMWGATA